MPSFRTCPECSERISPDAARCGCGWQASGKKYDKSGPEWNNVCTWAFGELRCKNPVGLFQNGETSGRCLLHRHHPAGRMAADIARESAIHDRESYEIAIRRETHPAGGTTHERKLRDAYQSNTNARRGGNVAAGMEHWIELCRQRSGKREAA